MLDFALEPDAGITGIVFSPDGEFASGAYVYLCASSQHLNLQDGVNRQKEDGVYAVTDADGEFSFPQQNEEYLLVIVHDEGYAEIESDYMDVSSKVFLQHWSRVEGDLYLGSKPAADENITLYPRQRHEEGGPRFSSTFKTQTDSEGYFVFEKIPPGKIQVSQAIKLGRWSSTNGLTEQAEVAAGESIYVKLGGNGRRVVGKLEYLAGHVLTTNNTQARIVTDRPKIDYSDILYQFEMPKPDDYETMTAKEVIDWYTAWNQSEEGRERNNLLQKKINEKLGVNQSKHYSVIVKDGSFWVEGVAAGDYKLSVDLCKAGQWGPDYQNKIAEKRMQFTIPEVTEDNIDIPYDLGEIRLEKEYRLEAGLTAPDFEVKGIDGSKIRLADFRGKLLLLNFWRVATEIRPENEGHMDHIKSLHEMFDKSGLQVLGLHYEQTGRIAMYNELSERYLKEKGITFKQGIINNDSKEMFTGYSINRYPANILVGPDGKIIASGLKGQELEDAVNAALEQLTPAEE